MCKHDETWDNTAALHGSKSCSIWFWIHSDEASAKYFWNFYIFNVFPFLVKIIMVATRTVLWKCIIFLLTTKITLMAVLDIFYNNIQYVHEFEFIYIP